MVHFDGESYDPKHDEVRLATQLERVRQAMLLGKWRTLDQLIAMCGGTAASVSARLRDLRKGRFGGYRIVKRRVGDPANGLWEYKMTTKKKRKVKRYPPTWGMIHADCLTAMRDMQNESVHCIVTSPPYWRLRDYDEEGQHGSEPTLEEWLEVQKTVFREAYRILRNDGTLWVNIGDNFVGGAMVGQPWKLAFALIELGFVLKMDCVWAKPNPMPEPAKRKRPTLAHEYIFMFTKTASTADYFYDAEAIKEVHNPSIPARGKRSIWHINSGGAGEEGHFAAFPPELPEICIKAGTSEKGCCEVCGAPFVRKMELTEYGAKVLGKSWHDHVDDAKVGQRGPSGLEGALYKTVGWKRPCEHKGFGIVPATVFDMYTGSGTTGEVALALGRSFQGIELKKKWYNLARKRLIRGASKGGRITEDDLRVRKELGLMGALETRLFGEP